MTPGGPENKPEDPESLKRNKASNREWFKAEFNMLRERMSQPKTSIGYSQILEENIPTQASPEQIVEARQRKYEILNRDRHYHGPSVEELTHRKLLIKSIEIDRAHIVSMNIFIQELIKQGYEKNRKEIDQLTREVEKLKVALSEKRKIVEESITSIIDQIEENTPGLKETLADERRMLEAVAEDENREGFPA